MKCRGKPGQVVPAQHEDAMQRLKYAVCFGMHYAGNAVLLLAVPPMIVGTLLTIMSIKAGESFLRGEGET